MQEKLKMYDEFRNKYWTVEKVKNITLEEYTNLDKTSFTYDVETKSRNLGSIKGISSFIFGIYKRQNKDEKEDKRQYVYRDNYAWDKQFGSNEKEVFENVKHWVNEVIKHAQNSNFSAIDNIPLYSMYKWKIAFLYQNEKDVTITPIYTYDALRWFLQTIGSYKNGMTMSEMYIAIGRHKQFSTIEDALKFGVDSWNDYCHFDIEEEKLAIKNNRDLSSVQRKNATSNLELIEYYIKAYKIQRRNPHNHLEKSFRKFLEANKKIQNIIQNDDCIDFHFELDNKRYICELKPSNNQKEIKYAVQSAIGQILGYSYNKNYDLKVIVFQNKPDKKNLKFLEYLADEHNIHYLYEKSDAIFKGNILQNKI